MTSLNPRDLRYSAVSSPRTVNALDFSSTALAKRLTVGSIFFSALGSPREHQERDRQLFDEVGGASQLRFEPWAEGIGQRQNESVVFVVDFRRHGSVDLVAIRVDHGACCRKQFVCGHAEEQVAVVSPDCIAIERIEAVEDLERSLAQPHQKSLTHVHATIGRRFRAAFAAPWGTP